MTTEQREPLYASTAKPWLKYYDQKYIDMPLPKCSAFEFLCHQNKNHLSETALEYYGRKFTFADLFVNVKKTAAAFRALGVKKGDIITVVSVMTPEVIYAFYAVDMIGATLNLVDPRYSVEGIHEYIEEVDSRLLICLNVTYERCHKAEKRTNVERVLVISPADSLPLHLAVGYKLTNPDKNRYKSNVIHWKDFIAQGKDQSMNAEPYDPQHACVVVHTGGTTGSPKGVMLTDDSFNSLAHEFIAQSNLFCRGQKLMNVMPPFIAYGYACGVHMPLVMGLHVVIIPNLDPDKLGALIWKHKPEHMFGVPAHYQQMAASPLLKKKKDLSFIRNYAAGGDSLPLGAELTVNEFLKAHNVEYPLAKGYGMTEVASAATVAAGNVTKPGSVGIPMLNTVVSIFEPGTETELPIGERGEICICTPTVMKGYYKMPEETAKAIDANGFLHSGDMGTVDEDGYYRVTGRIKDMIIRGGENVYPLEVENFLLTMPGVLDAQVVGIPDARLGEIVGAFIRTRPGYEDMTEDDVRAYAIPRIARYKVPKRVFFVDDFPMTPSMKVQKFKLREMAEELVKSGQ